jgi:chemotaxis protein MotB
VSGNDDQESSVQELVIIRRRGGDEEGGHKGGVWKIAYADFMTAMMAFFLVMWLINSADKKVLTQVAAYFNPMRLTDRAPTPRGMHDSESGATGNEDQAGTAKDPNGKAKGARLGPAEQKQIEEMLFNDPYGALEKLAKEGAAAIAAERQRAPAAPSRPGEAFRNPYDPEFQFRAKPDTSGAAQPNTGVPQAPMPAGQTKDAAPEQAAATDASKSDKPATDAKQAANAAPGQSESQPAQPLEKQAADAAQPQSDNQPAQAPAKQTADAAQSQRDNQAAQALDKQAAERAQVAERAEAAKRAEAARLDAELKQALAQLGTVAAPDVEIRVTDEGILISLTDKFDFGMFAIGSAEPRPATVVVMEKLAKVLQARAGRIIVRGHTDGRPFRSTTYDNWRLSTARAHMAYYMLVRGGIEEQRFERVEGHADRNLRVPADPGAAQNRRIELLLREPKQ